MIHKVKFVNLVQEIILSCVRKMTRNFALKIIISLKVCVNVIHSGIIFGNEQINDISRIVVLVFKSKLDVIY